MSVRGLKVGVIGGSISGCAAAIALLRAGLDVEVFERSTELMDDRGSGIVTPAPLRQELMAKGYLTSDYPFCEIKKRWWQYKDGTWDGRRLWTQPTLVEVDSNNWGNLWAHLRASIPDERYHESKELRAFEETGGAVVAAFADGTERTFDLLVGADGYHSVVRNALHPEAEPAFSNYILWRGNYPETEVEDRRFIDALDRDKAWLIVPFEGGHCIFYMIPDFQGAAPAGARRVNWGVYTSCPPSLRLNGVESLPPGSVDPVSYASLLAVLDDHFPPAAAALVKHSPREHIAVQPIYDSVVDTYVSDRVLLLGDAGSTTRPHTASGATKALEDALAIDAIAQNAADLPDLLSRYDAVRCSEAKRISRLSRRIGQAQVVDTPEWSRMTPQDFEAWIKDTLSGEQLFIFGEAG